PMALRLAANPLYAIVGDTLFIHAGVSPAHVLYGLARMEQELQAWMRGEGGDCPAVLEGRDAPVWMRNYSSTEAPPDCGMLAEVLGSLGLRRMVVGHTVQPHVNAACDGHVWRIDTGMSAVYGGPVEALEIRGDVLRVLSRQEPPAAQH
ncbi:MAG: calcineurin, partial [Deltaproteobacteria bacterium]|nr:calcineurin [Deltaproteobacteria bacterium]